MTPSIETRLKAIIGALEHLVLPALANADSIVQEQAALSLGHLKIIVMQVDDLAAKLQGKGFKVQVIGDAREPRSYANAIQEAAYLSRQL